MSYPVLKAPYGLNPVNLVGGQVYAGGVRHIPIKSGEAKAMANGDMVGVAADGTIKLVLGAADSKTQIGVFVGCHWTDEHRGYVNANRYPGGVVADNIMAIVVDDPDVVMRVAVVDNKGVTGVSTPAVAAVPAVPGVSPAVPAIPAKWAATTVDRSVVGKNIAGKSVVSTLAHGRSNLGVVSGTEAVVATLPFRVVDVVEETSPEAGKFTELLVKWNVHAYNVPLAPQAT